MNETTHLSNNRWTENNISKPTYLTVYKLHKYADYENQNYYFQKKNIILFSN